MTNAASPPVLSHPDTSDIPTRVGTFLEEYSEIATIIPVLTGLFVTSRLQLRGASALMANLAIAAVTRQVVMQLKQQAHPTPASAAAQPAPPATISVPASTEQEDYTIVHSTPGRLRLRIPRILTDAAYARRLEKILAADDRVMGVRLNRAAASVVIRYDGAGVSELELGMRLLQLLAQAEQEVPRETDRVASPPANPLNTESAA